MHKLAQEIAAAAHEQRTTPSTGVKVKGKEAYTKEPIPIAAAAAAAAGNEL